MAEIDWRQMPSLGALRAFEATARLGGFSAAARRLNVTHAAVAQQVRALEAHLGQPLLRRDGRALRLTEAGERLASSLTRNFTGIQEAVRAVGQREEDRPLRITMTPSFATQWLMPRLARFWQKHPDIGLSLHPDHRVSDLALDRIDIAIRFGNGNWPGIRAEFLTPARYIVVGAPSLIGDRQRLSIAEMQQMPWVKESDWPEQAQWLTNMGIDPARIEYTEFPNEELALAAAREGFGLHIESATLIAGDLESGRLIALSDTPEQTLGYYVVTPDGPRSVAARAFISWLRSEA